MRIKLKLFSIAKDLGGFDEQVVEVPPDSVAEDVLHSLIQKNTKFIDWKKSLRYAVNLEYVSDDFPLHDGDEVAVIPPVSGG
ncbi:MAG: MoaD/ThiS family protein [Ignavibacteriales bacterium]|nr:MoaD/ThiS family protein [Ignavibacteriales bacterium]